MTSEPTTSPRRDLEPGVYGLKDLRPGDRYEIGQVQVSTRLVDRFADLTGDHFAIHMSDDAALALGFERRVAHGLLVLSLVDGLKNQCPVQLRAIASLGWDWNFSAPVFAEDWIGGRVEIVSTRQTSDLERGIVALQFTISNDKNVVVQQGTNQLMIGL